MHMILKSTYANGNEVIPFLFLAVELLITCLAITTFEPKTTVTVPDDKHGLNFSVALTERKLQKTLMYLVYWDLGVWPLKL